MYLNFMCLKNLFLKWTSLSEMNTRNFGERTEMCVFNTDNPKLNVHYSLYKYNYIYSVYQFYIPYKAHIVYKYRAVRE